NEDAKQPDEPKEQPKNEVPKEQPKNEDAKQPDEPNEQPKNEVPKEQPKNEDAKQPDEPKEQPKNEVPKVQPKNNEPKQPVDPPAKEPDVITTIFKVVYTTFTITITSIKPGYSTIITTTNNKGEPTSYQTYIPPTTVVIVKKITSPLPVPTGDQVAFGESLILDGYQGILGVWISLIIVIASMVFSMVA
ncbi:2649_t:CDS:2, partial [Funneliformis caledonium]